MIPELTTPSSLPHFPPCWQHELAHHHRRRSPRDRVGDLSHARTVVSNLVHYIIQGDSWTDNETDRQTDRQTKRQTSSILVTTKSSSSSSSSSSSTSASCKLPVMDVSGSLGLSNTGLHTCSSKILIELLPESSSPEIPESLFSCLASAFTPSSSFLRHVGSSDSSNDKCSSSKRWENRGAVELKFSNGC